MRHGGYRIPFFKREPYRLTFIPRGGGKEYIKKTNISDDDMTIITLSKTGYGSMEYLKGLDTDQFLDLVEFEHISRAIENHIINENKPPGVK